VDFGSVPANLVKSAVVGGSGSVLGGGKFANGAVTGAFVYVLNELSHKNFRAQVREATDVLKDYAGIDFTKASQTILSEIDNRLPRWARTVFAGVSGSVNAGAGGTAGAGTYWDRQTGEYGTWGMYGGGVGISLGATPIIGFITGGAQDLCCYFEQYEGSFGANIGYLRGLADRPVYRDGRYIPDRLDIYGGYIGVGDVGVSASVTYTYIRTLGNR